MNPQVAILTNASDYAGPPVAAALAARGLVVLCHGEDFTDAAARAAYEDAHPGRTASAAGGPEELVADAVERYGRVDVAVSNDFGDMKAGGFVDRTPEDLRDLLEVFTVHPARLALAVAPVMRVQGSGRIVFVTSGAPLGASSGMAFYGAARAGAHALVRSLARELGPDGIAVNAVAPFFLDSNYLPRGMDDPSVAQQVRARVPMRRLGRPDEVGALIGFLASGEIDFMSGQVIAFSGGGV
ncbi:SDR family oxidoreductase [Pseudonocardia kujensis]|uniref:SDR family oxidoreductase n=1 Tax=Pseudonocardia kujensis TaxID=1128675 RepID=UPI001E29DC87|nr:SDR family oxidoreductase [Pseudonocardia kujensis]MCE0765980.1 SDR family oxidoreductase [Pseudonocardia kujensis]